MARKLGEVLIERGRLSEKQLQEALRSQRIFGGTLGTHLVQLGLVDEHGLADALAAMHDVPATTRDALLGAPAEVVALLSPEFAKRHRALPFQVDGEDLHLALQNPADSLAIHEAAFLTGFNVVPFVAPEVVLRDALGQFHDLPVPREIPDRRAVAAAENAAPAAEPETPSVTPPPPPQATPTAAPAPEQPEPSDGPEGTLARLGRMLSSAATRDEVVDTVLEALASQVPSACVFAIRGEEAVLYRRSGQATHGESRLSVSLAASEIFRAVREPMPLFAGRVEGTAVDRDLLRQLGLSDAPELLVVVPVFMRSRPIVVFLGASEHSADATADPEILGRLGSLTSMALEAVLLRAKILKATGHE